jgi:HTH-type transcriptional regulator/antitoxin MqsA
MDNVVTAFYCYHLRRKTITEPSARQTGVPRRRDMRSMTLTYKGESITFDMPGWYCDLSDESTHSGVDMRLSDRMLNRLKARTEGLLKPEEK